MPKFTKGQPVFVSVARRRAEGNSLSRGPRQPWDMNPEELEAATVVSVGRLYTKLDRYVGYRVGNETGRPDDPNAYFRVWTSREEYADAKDAAAAWDELRVFIGRSYQAPDGLPADAIRGALALLKAAADDE